MNLRASAIVMKSLPATAWGDALLISREEARRIGYELEACAERMDQNVPEGMALVPVDDLEAIVEVVRGMLYTAYQNAMPVCCGKRGQQCCGNLEPEWNASDMEVMDSLGPVEKRISAMLAATKEKGE